MKMIKKVMFVALAVLVASSFAAKKVKSKIGDVDLTKEKGGGSVVCTAGFNDELTIVKEADTDVLVKGACGQGWVEKSKIEYVAALAGDKSMKLDFDGVNIDRDFKEYLQHTMDREQMEMHNNEN